MKTLRLTFAAILFLAILLVTAAQINYQEAILDAKSADSDGEIQAILQEHGFQVDIYEEITTEEKIKALFR